MKQLDLNLTYQLDIEVLANYFEVFFWSLKTNFCMSSFYSAFIQGISELVVNYFTTLFSDQKYGGKHAY